MTASKLDSAKLLRSFDENREFLDRRYTENVEKYAYWWSNIAVKETPKTRVIVPASKTYMSSYNKNAYYVGYVDNPFVEGRDSSYPLTAPRSNDYFYDLDKGEEKWITAVNEEGEGLLQLSTDRLYGRKLFVWGQGNGGKNCRK